MTRHCATCGREWDEQSAAYAKAREAERRELAAAIRRTRRYWIASWLVVLFAAAFMAYLLWAKR